MAKKTIALPRGTAKFPWLNQPDTKYGEDYKCDLMVELGDCNEVCAQIEDELEDYFQKEAEKAEASGKYRSIEKAELPFFEEGGLMLFRTKLNKNGKNKKTGEEWINKITFYDAKGKPIPEGQVPKIGGGSVLRINCEYNFWPRTNIEGRGDNKVMDLELGVSLRIKGVQVIEARQGGGPAASAESMGFGEEEGYSYDPDSFDAGADGEDEDF